MSIWSFDSVFAYVFRNGIVGWKLNWGFDGYCGLLFFNFGACFGLDNWMYDNCILHGGVVML